MSIILSGVNYRYTNRQPLFEPVNLSVLPGEKISIVGNNGTGKSTLLRLIAGELAPSCGSIGRSVSPYYVPQQTDIRSESVGRTLGVAEKLDALRAICDGSANPDHYDTLADDWDIESRCRSALDAWGLPHVELTASTDSLSGGEKTRLSLAGLTIHRPAIVLLDEPTNHLDRTGRDRLYDYIRTCKATLIVVSHDTYLLNLLDRTCELSKKGLKTYGGNYNFYREQKRIEDSALEQRIDSEQAALRLARKKAQEIAERQQKRFNQGERNKDRLPRILRKGAKDRGETTISKLREKHSDIVGLNEKRLNDLRRQRGTACRFKIDFDDALLHNGKLLIAADGVNFGYDRERPLWRIPLDLEIRSGERIRLTGNNGSGKTTLVRLLTGELFPTAGEIRRTDFSYVCLDQEYSLVDTPQTVLELAQKYNRSNLCDHEIKMRLKRVLFAADTWDTSCNALSGGEKMRLCLCCLMISNHVPDLFILDEPTNNLDLSSLAVLADTIGDYRGTLLVISHDRNFTDEIGITKTVELG
ncbi:ABC-F family ATP-binding cassette domain-containing protein [Alistipes sp. cv1]|uniref:ABC-F family ATP-binding cassette domain-containing protein n=1 Tax=Alistipes sp. cv1 TaxID=1622071 RepID=UPI000C78DA4C|nr:ABC-F family ATP-binding cassette domain-containing protein [Alistipes sp. cv1]